MTGMELKQTAAVLGALGALLLLLPALIVTGLRRFATCDASQGSGQGLISTSLVFVGYLLLLYAVLVYKQWDDSQRIAFLLGYPISQALIAGLNALAVVLLSLLFARWLPAKEPHVCRELFPFLLAAFGFLWFDITRNEQSVLIQLLRG